MKRLLLGALCLLPLAACSSTEAEDYADNSPKLDIRSYFNGELKAYGTYFSRSGEAKPQFTISMVGEWQGNDGTLKEHFVYNDGHTQDRMWKLHVVDDHHVTGTAADVDGVAKGKMYGNTLNMRYSLHIQSKDGKMGPALSAEDWIFLMDEKTAINRTKLSKFGINAGEMVITFQKM